MQLETYETYKQRENLGSDLFSHVKTEDVVQAIVEATDFRPKTYRESRVRDKAKAGFQPHEVTMELDKASPYYKPMVALGDIAPQVGIVNAYDGTTLLDVNLGFLRLACLNGMKTGKSIASFTQKHIGFDFDALEAYIKGLPEYIERGQEAIIRMSEKSLSSNEIAHFANKALEIRGTSMSEIRDRYTKKYDEAENFGEILTTNMVRPKRYDDRKNDLWTVFNVLQEKVIRGFSVDRVPIKKISSVTESARINRELWDQAETYLVA